RLGAGLDHALQDVLLLLGVALHGLDKVGDEVGAALVLVLHLAPGRLGLLLVGRHVVEAAAPEGERQERRSGDGAEGFEHGTIPVNRMAWRSAVPRRRQSGRPADQFKAFTPAVQSRPASTQNRAPRTR